MQLIKVINARNVLESLADRDDIGTHLSYWMAKFVIATRDEYRFYTTEMQKIINQYAQTEQAGGEDTIRIPPENLENFRREVHILEETEVECPNIKFALSDIVDKLKLSMKQLYPLLDFIDEGK